MSIKTIIGTLVVGIAVLWIISAIRSHPAKRDTSSIVQASPADKWHVTEEQSPMDDSKTVLLTTDSDDQIQGPLGAVRPSLIVRCKEKKTDLYVVTGLAADVERNSDGGPSDSHKVGLRLDDAPATYESWTESTDHKALFASDLIWGQQWDSLLKMNVPQVVAYSEGVVELAKKLSGAGTLTFQFTPFDGSPQVARFALR